MITPFRGPHTDLPKHLQKEFLKRREENHVKHRMRPAEGEEEARRHVGLLFYQWNARREEAKKQMPLFAGGVS